MKKFVIAPDSFKGSLSAREFCTIAREEILHRFPQGEVVCLPIADGGEGSTDCFLTALGGTQQPCCVPGPYGDPVSCWYGILPDYTAVIEVAACAGMPLVKGKENPDKTTTFGVGGLLKDALGKGCRKFLLCLGGSATNDGGAGMACALGVRFFDETGGAFVPTGDTLCCIRRIDATRRIDLEAVTLTALCDVTNPLTGPQGAAAVFAPQKGADSAQVQRLEEGLCHLSNCIRRDLGMDVSRIPGSGAAGGLGAGVIAFCDGRLQSGIQTVLETVRFFDSIQGADLILTGEGRIDAQSMQGKVISGVARAARQAGVPVLALAGQTDLKKDALLMQGVREIRCINPPRLPLDQAMEKAAGNLRRTLRAYFSQMA